MPLVCPWPQANLPGHADRMWTSNGYVLDESPTRLGELRPVPDAERTDRKRLRARLRRDGYLFLPGALAPAESIAFRRYYFATLAPTGLVRPETDPAAGLAGDDVARDKLRALLFGEIVPGETYARFCHQPAIRGLVCLVPRRRADPAPPQDHPAHATRGERAGHRDRRSLRPALPPRRHGPGAQLLESLGDCSTDPRKTRILISIRRWLRPTSLPKPGAPGAMRSHTPGRSMPIWISTR